MYRFLLAPRWIAAHLVVIILEVALVAFGIWQLGRLDERRAEVALIESRIRRPPAGLEKLLASPDTPAEQAERSAYRRVAVRGTFDAGREVLLEGRSNLGRPGRHVLTPLRTGADSAIIVDRGWVPMPLDDPPIIEAAPPVDEVRVTGILLPPPPRSSFGPPEPSPGPVQRLPRVDLERLDDQLPYRLYPLYLQLRSQQPPNRDPVPRPADPPKLDEGPHLSYAIQWFSFAAIAGVTYLAFVRRQVSTREGSV